MNDGVEKYVAMERATIYDVYEEPLDFYKARVTCCSLIDFEQHISDECYHIHWDDEFAHRDKVALDFGCGVARLMVGWNRFFKRIDGVDFSVRMLERAQENLAQNGIVGYDLYHTNGYDLAPIPSNTYDMVYSQLVFEHIAVWDIRYNYLKEFKRVLKDGGRISILTKGGRYKHPERSAAWRENAYDAPGTNGKFDARLEDVFEVVDDLVSIGYKDIRFKFFPIEEGRGGYAGHTHFVLLDAVNEDCRAN